MLNANFIKRFSGFASIGAIALASTYGVLSLKQTNLKYNLQNLANLSKHTQTLTIAKISDTDFSKDMNDSQYEQILFSDLEFERERWTEVLEIKVHEKKIAAKSIRVIDTVKKIIVKNESIIQNNYEIKIDNEIAIDKIEINEKIDFKIPVGQILANMSSQIKLINNEEIDKRISVNETSKKNLDLIELDSQPNEKSSIVIPEVVNHPQSITNDEFQPSIDHTTNLNIEDEVSLISSLGVKIVDKGEIGSNDDYSTSSQNDIEQRSNQAKHQLQSKKIEAHDLVIFDYSKNERNISKSIQPKESKQSPIFQSEVEKALSRMKADINKKTITNNEYSKQDQKRNTNDQFLNSQKWYTIQTIGGLNDNQEDVRLHDAISKDEYFADNGKYGFQNFCKSSGECQHIGNQKLEIIDQENRITNFYHKNESSQEVENIPHLSTKMLHEVANHYHVDVKTTLLVKLSEGLDDFQIDTKSYDGKLYLSSQFKLVDPNNNDYEYLLFTGMKPGIKVGTYRTINNDSLTKIFSIVYEQTNYLNHEISNKGRTNFYLGDEHILSKKIIPLATSSQSLEWMSKDASVQIDKIGHYYVLENDSLLNERSYFKYNNGSSKMYFGFEKNNKIKVPSKTYIHYVLGMLNINKMKDNECLIQINLSKKIVDLKIQTNGINGELIHDITYLDGDGLTYSNVTDQTKKIFIYGYELGSYGLRIDYANGQSENIESYCSDRTYLVEQL